MDLGLSTDQLEASRRGFSFQRDEPLLMSFNEAPEEGGLTAAAILNQWSEGELAKIFSELGEERFARRIARAVVTRRQEKTIIGTQELVAIIEGAVPGWYRGLRRHSATKIFQALRMAVNDELEALAEGLAAAWRLLPQGGRLAVISFHSGEARLVKEFCRSRVGEGTAEWVGKRVTHPSQAEILANPAARSAQLRAILKK
jgi:16S rRNA (cytosine1402-N4)-methyltransferase